MSLFLEKSISEIHNLIKSNELTFLDLANESAVQIQSAEPNTMAWVTYDTNQLKHKAEKSYEDYKMRGFLRPLDGMPFGIKDIFNTKDFPTEMGSSLWKGFTPGNNARVVDSLYNAGALGVGKTVTAEFAVHSLNETLNPHDHTRTPGTSSSGSAAAVSTGMVPFALATQTAGSIIRPASFCGVWGMKPSFGLIPRTGSLKTTDSLDSIGFLTTHATNLRTLLNAVRVKGPNYPFVYNNVDKRGEFPKTKKPWKIGFVKTHVWNGAKDYARNEIVNLANRISKVEDFKVEEINWPQELQNSHEIHEIIYNKSLSYYFQHERTKSTEVTPIMLEMISNGENVSIASYKDALNEQEIYSEKIDSLFSDYDLVLSLGTSSSAPLRGETEIRDPSLIWTLSHIPSVGVPMFRCPEGLPFGVQFVSRKWNDYLLLEGIEELVVKGILPSGSMPIRNLKS